jgi:hypothetical protein
MAGGYLMLGRARWCGITSRFVRASQRPDGNVPIAISPADSPPPGLTDYGRGMRYPQDVYEYAPFGQKPRKWIGLFHHWQMNVNPLSMLGSVSYVLTAAEIWRDGKDAQWLKRISPPSSSAENTCSRARRRTVSLAARVLHGIAAAEPVGRGHAVLRDPRVPPRRGAERR